MVLHTISTWTCISSPLYTKKKRLIRYPLLTCIIKGLTAYLLFAKGDLESDAGLIINLRMRKIATPHWQPARVKSIMFNLE